MGFGLWLRTEAGGDWAQRQLEQVLATALTEGSVGVRELQIDPFGGLLLRGLVLRDGQGREVVHLEQVVADLQPSALMARKLVVPRLRAEGLSVELIADADGSPSLARMFASDEPASDAPWSGLPIDLDLRDVEIGSTQVRSVGPDGVSTWLTGLAVGGRVDGRGKRIAVDGLRLDGFLAVPGPLPFSARGDVVWDDGALDLTDLMVRAPGNLLEIDGSVTDAVDLEVRLVRADLATFDPLANEPGLKGTLEGNARISGPLHDVRAVMTLDGTDATRGGLRLRLGGDLSGDRWNWTAKGEILDLHLDHLLGSLTEPLVLDGQLDVEGGGRSWPDDLSMTGRYTGGEQQVAGQLLRSVDLGFQLREGVIYLQDDSTLEGVVGTVRPEGWVDVAVGLIDLQLAGELDPRDLQALGAAGLRTPGRFEARVIGSTGGVEPLGITAEARFGPFRYDAVAAEQLAVGFRGDVSGGVVTAALDLRGTGVDLAGGVTSRSLTSEGLQLTVAGGHTRVNGALSLGDAVAGGVLWTETLSTRLDVDVSDAALLAQVGLQLGAYTLLEQPGTEGRGRVDVVGDQVAVSLELTDGDRQELVLEGGYDLPRAELHVADLRWSPTHRVDFSLAGPSTLALTEGGGIRTDRLDVEGVLGRLSFSGEAGAAGVLAGSLSVTDLQLDVVSELFPDQARGLSGTAQLTATLAGTAADPDVDARFRVDDLYLDDAVRFLDVAGHLRWVDDVLTPTLSLAVVDVPFAELSGHLPTSGGLSDVAVDLDGSVDLVAALRPGGFERMSQVSPALAATTLPDGVFSATVGLQGTLRDPRLHTAGVAEIDVPGWRDPGRTEFDVVREGEYLSFWADLREGYAQRANLGGGGATRFGEVWSWSVEGGPEPDLDDPTLWLDEMFLSGVLLGVPVESLLAIVGTPLDATGDLVGGVSVTGSPTTPTVEGGLHWLEPRVGGSRLDGAYASLQPDGAAYQVDLQLEFPDEGHLGVSGPAPFAIDTRTDPTTWSTGPLALAIQGSSVPFALAEAVDDGIHKAEGSIDVDGAVQGTFDQLQPIVSLSMRDGSCQYLPLDLELTEIRLTANASNEQVAFSFGARTDPRRKYRAAGLPEVGLEPRVSGDGTIALSDGAPTDVKATIHLRDGAWLSARDDTSLRLDGDLKLAGTWPAVSVDGKLDLVYGDIVLDAAAFIDSAPLQLDPRLTVLRGQVPTRVQAEPDLPPFYADFDVNVAIDLGRNLEVDVAMPFIDDLGSLGAAVTRADVSSRLGGALVATVDDGQLDLVGEVDVLEGKVRVLRSSFDLSEGSVAFTGADPYNPQLDLSAVMNVTDAQLDMSISGTPEEPVIAFSSEEYPDQTQIMTILLTGRAPDDMDATQGQGTAQALAQLLLNSLFAGQSLGSFSIEPDGSVRLGIPVAQSIYASSTLAATQNPNENRLTVGLEASPLPKVVLSGSVGDRRSSADIYWEIRF